MDSESGSGDVRGRDEINSTVRQPLLFCEMIKAIQPGGSRLLAQVDENDARESAIRMELGCMIVMRFKGRLLVASSSASWRLMTHSTLCDLLAAAFHERTDNERFRSLCRKAIDAMRIHGVRRLPVRPAIECGKGFLTLDFRQCP